MMKVILIGGYPASGKSAIVATLIERLRLMGHVLQPAKYGNLLQYMTCPVVNILGVYAPDELFPGTDKLAMNVQPEIETYLMETSRSKKNVNILMEGDRVFNEKMIVYLRTFIKCELFICVVKARSDIVQRRQETRSVQNANWRKGRETKINKITLAYPVHVYMENNVLTDIDTHADTLLSILQGNKHLEPSRPKIQDLWK